MCAFRITALTNNRVCWNQYCCLFSQRCSLRKIQGVLLQPMAWDRSWSLRCIFKSPPAFKRTKRCVSHGGIEVGRRYVLTHSGLDERVLGSAVPCCLQGGVCWKRWSQTRPPLEAGALACFGGAGGAAAGCARAESSPTAPGCPWPAEPSLARGRGSSGRQPPLLPPCGARQEGTRGSSYGTSRMGGQQGSPGLAGPKHHQSPAN